jgi:hypothetical protein
METPGIDKRLVKAIVEAVNYEKKYAMSLATIESFVKDQGQTMGEGYKLLGEFYDAISEGRLKGVYLIRLYLSLFEKHDFVFFVSPVELTNDQLKTLDTLVDWVKEISSHCKKLDAEEMAELVIDRLIATWSGERYDKGLYKFAINNGVTSESELAELGIKVPSLANPNNPKRGDGYD